ncbi:hypothetical protein BC332_04179 [Capsicum chinense]|nr:hypothetical protein BC332_04179 [Capsicum chinense]
MVVEMVWDLMDRSYGRKELMSFLKRRKYKEMVLSSLKKKRLGLSPLELRFHLRDSLGSGHLKTIEAPTGLLVKVGAEVD